MNQNHTYFFVRSAKNTFLVWCGILVISLCARRWTSLKITAVHSSAAHILHSSSLSPPHMCVYALAHTYKHPHTCVIYILHLPYITVYIVHICICSLYVYALYIYMNTYTYFLLNYSRVSCGWKICYILPWPPQHICPKNKSILLHKYNTIITVLQYYLLIYIHTQIYILYGCFVKPRIQSRITNCMVLLSSVLQSPAVSTPLSLSPHGHCWRVQASHFAECS